MFEVISIAWMDEDALAFGKQQFQVWIYELCAIHFLISQFYYTSVLLSQRKQMGLRIGLSIRKFKVHSLQGWTYSI